MSQSASASPTRHPTVTLLRYPAATMVVVMLVAMIWASVGFASALFTNDIVVSDKSYGVIRLSIAGPAVLAILAVCSGLLALVRWTRRHV